jgi:hypothetical protein
MGDRVNHPIVTIIGIGTTVLMGFAGVATIASLFF